MLATIRKFEISKYILYNVVTLLDNIKNKMNSKLVEPSTVKDLETEIKRLRNELDEKEEIIKKLESSANNNRFPGSDSNTIEQNQHNAAERRVFINGSNGTVPKDETHDTNSIEIHTIYQGDGEKSPSMGDVVKMHYKLSLESDGDGENIIEDSRVRYGGDPFSFKMGENQVIEGIELVLLKMRKAEVAEFDVPSHLAYGDEGFGDVIPGGEYLHCRLEVIDFYTYEAPAE